VPAAVEESLQPRSETACPLGKWCRRLLDDTEELVVEPLVERQDKGIPVGEVHIERPLGHTGLPCEIGDG
jgi:hypothetical protein